MLSTHWRKIRWNLCCVLLKHTSGTFYRRLDETCARCSSNMPQTLCTENFMFALFPWRNIAHEWEHLQPLLLWGWVTVFFYLFACGLFDSAVGPNMWEEFTWGCLSSAGVPRWFVAGSQRTFQYVFGLNFSKLKLIHAKWTSYTGNFLNRFKSQGFI
jgi:hypothetical protein